MGAVLRWVLRLGVSQMFAPSEKPPACLAMVKDEYVWYIACSPIVPIIIYTLSHPGQAYTVASFILPYRTFRLQ